MGFWSRLFGARRHKHEDRGKEVTPLGIGIYSGNPALVRLALDNGADVNELTSEGGYLLPLTLAAQLGHLEIVLLLIDRGALVNDDCGMSSALHQAMGMGHAAVCAALKEAGAKCDEYLKFGWLKRIVER